MFDSATTRSCTQGRFLTRLRLVGAMLFALGAMLHPSAAEAAASLVTYRLGAPSSVRQGASGIGVQVLVANPGDSAVNLSSAGLTFASTLGADRTVDYDVVAAQGNPTAVAAGTTATFNFTVAVKPLAAPGAAFVAFIATATDASTQQTVTVRPGAGLVLFGGQPAAPANDTWTFDGTSWFKNQADGAAGAPSARAGSSAVLDSGRNRVVLFGGFGPRNDTWEWDGAGWTERQSDTASPGPDQPPQRASAAMAYDSARHVTVLFGGSGSGFGDFLNDTWEWDGTNWAQRQPSSSSASDRPAPRSASRAAYDSVARRVLLFGGANFSGAFNDTWAWNGTSWSQLQANNASPGSDQPPQRQSPAMAFDGAQGKLVLFGGLNSTGSTRFNDTWERDSLGWSNKQPDTATPGASQPAQISDAAMAFDSVSNHVTLFGGAIFNFTFSPDTWTWGGSSWQKLSPTTAPSARPGAAMANGAPLQTLWTVRALPSLSAGSFDVPAAVLRGRQFVASVDVRNLGSGTADLTSTSLTFSNAGLSASAGPSNPTSIAGGVTATFDYLVSVSGSAATGTCTATLEALASARGGGDDVSLTTALSPTFEVLRPAALSVVDYRHTTATSQGRTFRVTVAVENTGDSPADLTSTSLLFSPSGLTVTARPTNPSAIAGGTTATFEFDVQVAGDASSGARTATFALQASDRTDGADVSLAQAALTGSITVRVPQTLTIAAVLPSTQTVKRGDSALGVRVLVNNFDLASSGAAVNNIGLSLLFNGTRTGYTVHPANGNPTVCGTGSAVFLDFTVDVGAQAANGPTTLTAEVLSADDALSGDPARIVNEAYGDWTVSAYTLTADAGTEQFGTSLTPISLDGRASTVVGTSTALTYHWSVFQRPFGSQAGVSSLAPNDSTAAGRTSFTPDRFGAYVIRLRVSVEDSLSDPDDVTVTVTSVPVARIAGSPRQRLDASRSPGAALLFDGRNSFDPAGRPLIYHWSVTGFPAGAGAPAVTPNDSVAAGSASISPTVPGTYTVQLVVDADAAHSPPASAVFELASGSPGFILDPTPGQVIARSNVGGSSGARLLYRVSFTGYANGGSGGPQLSVGGVVSRGTAEPDGTATALVGLAPGSNTIALSSGGTVWDQVRVTVPDIAAPFAEIVTDTEPAGPRSITLDPGGSRVAPGSAGQTTFAWSLDGAPAGVTAFRSSAEKPSYTMTAIGRYVFSLTVGDTSGQLTGTAQAGFEVLDVTPTAPVFPDRTLYLQRSDALAPHPEATLFFNLDGRGASDASGQTLTYSWAIEEAPDRSLGQAATTTLVSLVDASTAVARANFSTATRATGGAPAMAAAGRYKFRLTVSDGTHSSSTVQMVEALDPATLLPNADPGEDQQLHAGVATLGGPITRVEVADPLHPGQKVGYVQLDGRNSADPQGRVLTAYRWSFESKPSGSTAELTGGSTALPRFVPDRTGDYAVRLVVSNGQAESLPRTVKFRIDPEDASTGVLLVTPRVSVLARDLSNLRESSAAFPVLETRVDRTVLLDGLDSTGDLVWSQLAGDPVEFNPNVGSRRATVKARTPGLRRFRATLADPASAESATLDVSFRPADPPVLSVISTASSTTATGHELQSETPVAPTGSLRVDVPSDITLTAQIAGAEASQPFDFAWRQRDGPTVLLSRLQERVLTGGKSIARFRVTTSRVHEFEVAATPLEAGTFEPSQPAVVKKLRIVASLPGIPIPQPVVQVRQITLSGAAKTASAPAGDSATVGVTVVSASGPTDLLGLALTAFGGGIQQFELDGSGSKFLENRPASETLKYSWIETTGDKFTTVSPADQLKGQALRRPTRETTAAEERAGVGCGGQVCAPSAELHFKLTIDASKPGDRSEPVFGAAVSGGLDRSALPPEAAGLRVFFNGSVPVSAVATQSGGLPIEFPSLAIPAAAVDGDVLTLEFTDRNGRPLRPAFVLRRSTLQFVAGGARSFTSLDDGTVQLSLAAKGDFASGAYYPTQAQLNAMVPSGRLRIGTPTVFGTSSGGGSGGGGGCTLTPARWLSQGANTVLLFSPALYLLARRRRRPSSDTR